MSDTEGAPQGELQPQSRIEQLWPLLIPNGKAEAKGIHSDVLKEQLEHNPLTQDEATALITRALESYNNDIEGTAYEIHTSSDDKPAFHSSQHYRQYLMKLITGGAWRELQVYRNPPAGLKIFTPGSEAFIERDAPIPLHLVASTMMRQAEEGLESARDHKDRYGTDSGKASTRQQGIQQQMSAINYYNARLSVLHSAVKALTPPEAPAQPTI